MTYTDKQLESIARSLKHIVELMSEQNELLRKQNVSKQKDTGNLVRTELIDR